MSHSRVTAAIEATPQGYFESTLAQRQPGADGAGSRFLSEVTSSDLKAADWQPYSHPAIMDGCVAFQAPLQGRFGLVQLSTLPADTQVVLDDRKQTGQVSAAVEGVLGEMVDFTVIILGQHEGSEICFTFHPGAPIPPSIVPADGRHGEKITVSEAMALGFEWAKLI